MATCLPVPTAGIQEDALDPNGDHQICPEELDSWITTHEKIPGEMAISRDLDFILARFLENDIETGKKFLKELSPVSRASLLQWSQGDLRGLLYEALENPEGGYLPISSRAFSSGTTEQFSFFEDYVLLPEEVRPDLPDVAFAIIAQIVAGAADRVLPERMSRFMNSLDCEARRRLRQKLTIDPSLPEILQSQMKHSKPQVAGKKPPSEKELADFLSFDGEVPAIIGDGLTALGGFVSIPLPPPAANQGFLVSKKYE